MDKKAGFLNILALAALLSGGQAVAQQANGIERLDRLFGQIDRDGNGVLTLLEMQAAAAIRFNALDVDGDGMVYPQERAQSRENRLKIGFGRADRDGNGMLDAAEMHALARQQANRRIVQLDRNGDGMISLEEMHHGQGQPTTPPTNPTGVLTLEALDAQMMAMFHRADANGDGRVTRSEAMAEQGR